MTKDEVFEIKRSMETYFQEQYLIQERIVTTLRSVEKSQRALISIFGQAAQKLDEK